MDDDVYDQEKGQAMTTQMVNVALPDEIYRRLQGMAAVTHQSLEEILVRTIRGNLPPTLDDLPPTQRDLVAELGLLGDEALWAVAKETLPARGWGRHRRLLRQAQDGSLTEAELAELAALREATDRFVTRRSVALALLKWRGHTLPAAS